MSDDVEAVQACLRDDAATLRDDNKECEIASNMDAAATLIGRLTEELAAANAERDKATRRAESAEFDVAAMKDRLAAYHEAANEEVWYWQGKDDHIESVVCRIVIKPEQMRAVLGELAAANKAREKAERERDVLREKLRIEEFYDDVSPSGVCTVCGGKTRYGERHSRCGSAVIAKEMEADALRAEIKRLTRESDGWKRDAERYCSNADYHYGEAKKLAQERDALRAEVERLREDAERWRGLRQIMESAKGGAFLEVNAEFAYYEKPEPGTEVSLQWYPDTPIGFYKIERATLNEAVDAAIDAARRETK